MSELPTSRPTIATMREKHPKVPESVISGMINYGWDRIPTGSFLRAVLENDLKAACAQADDINRHLLFEIVCLMYNDLDYRCQGSPDIVKKWLAGED